MMVLLSCLARAVLLWRALSGADKHGTKQGNWKQLLHLEAAAVGEEGRGSANHGLLHICIYNYIYIYIYMWLTDGFEWLL